MYLRYVRSIAWSTIVSIGRIMNGMAARPMQVGNHFRAIPGNWLRFDTIPAPHVIRLITKPGMITEANICQIKTSAAVLAAADILCPPSS